jgi:hypothetical protein
VQPKIPVLQERSVSLCVETSLQNQRERETPMKKAMMAAACILSLSAASALAQPSQGKAGSDNGPASNSATTNSSGPGASGSGGGAMTNGSVNNNGMQRDGTTGAGSGSSAPSSSGNVGPGTNNNSGKQPGGR